MQYDKALLSIPDQVQRLLGRGLICDKPERLQHYLATASRLIKEALDAGLIVPYDATAGRKYMKYLPWWAK